MLLWFIHWLQSLFSVDRIVHRIMRKYTRAALYFHYFFSLEVDTALPNWIKSMRLCSIASKNSTFTFPFLLSLISILLFSPPFSSHAHRTISNNLYFKRIRNGEFISLLRGNKLDGTFHLNLTFNKRIIVRHSTASTWVIFDRSDNR